MYMYGRSSDTERCVGDWACAGFTSFFLLSRCTASCCARRLCWWAPPRQAPRRQALLAGGWIHARLRGSHLLKLVVAPSGSVRSTSFASMRSCRSMSMLKMLTHTGSFTHISFIICIRVRVHVCARTRSRQELLYCFIFNNTDSYMCTGRSYMYAR